MGEYECPICLELSGLNGGILSKCAHLFCLECLNEQIEDKPECGLCRARFTKKDIIKIDYVLKSKLLHKRHLSEFEEFKINGSKKEEDDEKENEEDIKNMDKYDEFVKKYSETKCVTSKMKALLDRLKYIKQHHDGDKAIIFSNFSNYFGIIGKMLNEEKIKYLQFHSGLNRKKRAKVLEEFKSSKDCRILLISAKCASVGLNLMTANHVIFLDPRINAGLDNQAIGRCWRIGQSKKVFVTRLICKGTIEEKILSLQQEKESKAQQANAKNTNLKSKAKLTETDYDFIFDFKPDSNI